MRTRSQAVIATVVCFAACAGYLVVAWATLFQARIGPIVATVDAGAGRGVHSGDLLALPMVALAGLMFVLGAVCCDRAVRSRSRTPWRVASAA